MHSLNVLERLIDDCIMLDYGKILIQTPVDKLLQDLSRYTFKLNSGALPEFSTESGIINPSKIRDEVELFTFKSREELESILNKEGMNYTGLAKTPISLEDAFIGLTGKY